MKRIIPIMAVVCLLGWVSSCKEKPNTGDIIVKNVQEEKAPVGTQSMSEFTWDKEIAWMGGTYKLSIHRYPDTSLPQAEDEQGHKYYDNKIQLKITRADGSTFFDRVFAKTDFSEYTNNAFGRTGALLGLAFDSADGGRLLFGASVGSPDAMSDEYIPMVVAVSSTGSVTITSDNRLDTGGNDQPRDELEAAEAEGM